MRQSKIIRSATAGVVAGVLGLLTGCGQGAAGAPAQETLGNEGADASVREIFDYQLLTHCGIRWASFDGRRWITPFLGDRRIHGPPEGWDQPFQAGQMRMISDDLAVFTSEGHEPLTFRATKRHWPEPGCV